jgi:hypothetical protein
MPSHLRTPILLLSLVFSITSVSIVAADPTTATNPIGPIQLYAKDKAPLVAAPYLLSEQEEKKLTRDRCLMDRPALGDLGNYWSVGATVSTQAVKYTFGTKQASSATTVGVGVAFRYFLPAPLGTADAAKKLGFTDGDLTAIKKIKKPKDKDHGPFYDETDETYSLPIGKVSTACRATTSDIGKDRTEKLASSLLSITPTIYYAKQAGENNDLSVQPALLLGFFDDLISIGPGFNLTGPEKGKVFLVLSLGYGFKF